MNEVEKAEADIQDKKKSIEELKAEIIKLTTEFRKNQHDLNQQIFDQGKDIFADVNLEQLLIAGRTTHVVEIGKIKFTLQTLTKKETLFIDKNSKNYLNETRDFYINGVQSDTLAMSLVEYNGNKSPLTDDVEKSYPEAKASVLDLSDDMISMMWSQYTKMTRFIKAALELNLKN